MKVTAAERRGEGEEAEEAAISPDEEEGEAELDEARIADLRSREEFVLTVSEYGYGKRSSSYDFRVAGRGGKGIRATDPAKVKEIGQLIAAFPVNPDDQIMLVSDGGQIIRVPVDGIRIASRATKGVTIFSTAEDEKVVSVERISEPEETKGDDLEGDENDDAAPSTDGSAD